MESTYTIKKNSILEQLLSDINITPSWNNVNDAKNDINNLINKTLLKYNNFNIEQQSLVKSLENVIMASVHEVIFPLICEKYKTADELIYKKCKELSALKVTPDQLGALEDYAIPLPAAIVELASLDMHETPSEKLNCLSAAFDLAMAELKGAIVDVIALNSDNKIPMLNVSDITPILATIIIHAKPMHLTSNLCYIKHFYWSKLNATESECLLAIKTAIDKLNVVTPDLLLPRSRRIYCDISLEDIFKLTSELDDKYDRKGQRILAPNTPLERHVEQFTTLITAATCSSIENNE